MTLVNKQTKVKSEFYTSVPILACITYKESVIYMNMKLYY